MKLSVSSQAFTERPTCPPHRTSSCWLFSNLTQRGSHNPSFSVWKRLLVLKIELIANPAEDFRKGLDFRQFNKQWWWSFLRFLCCCNIHITFSQTVFYRQKQSKGNIEISYGFLLNCLQRPFWKGLSGLETPLPNVYRSRRAHFQEF